MFVSFTVSVEKTVSILPLTTNMCVNSNKQISLDVTWEITLSYFSLNRRASACTRYD